DVAGDEAPVSLIHPVRRAHDPPNAGRQTLDPLDAYGIFGLRAAGRWVPCRQIEQRDVGLSTPSVVYPPRETAVVQPLERFPRIGVAVGRQARALKAFRPRVRTSSL